MTISERVGSLMQEQRFSQRDVANYLGVTHATVQKWVSTNRPFSAEYIVPLSRLFKVSPIYLLTGVDSDASAVSEVPEIPEGCMELDEGEAALIEWFRELDYEGKIKVSGTAVDELRRVQQENEINAPAAKSGRAG